MEDCRVDLGKFHTKNSKDDLLLPQNLDTELGAKRPKGRQGLACSWDLFDSKEDLRVEQLVLAQ